MKSLKYLIVTLSAASLACAASAQTASATVQTPAASVSASAPAPQDLSYGASQVLKLQQAGLSTDVLINYVNSANASFSLRADDIVYLHNAGVPQEVITAMQQKQAPVAQNTAPAPAQQPVQSQPETTMVNPPSPQPSTTTVVTQPPVVYTSPTYVYPSYPSYPYYGYYGSPYYYGPSIRLGFGWGWGGHGWHGGYGGYHGGWHGGGGWHHH